MAPWWNRGPSKMDRLIADVADLKKRMVTGFSTVEGLLFVTQDEFNAINTAVQAQGAVVTGAATEIDAAVTQLVSLPPNDPRAQQLADAITAQTTSLKTESDKLASTLAGLSPSPAPAAPAAGQ